MKETWPGDRLLNLLTERVVARAAGRSTICDHRAVHVDRFASRRAHPWHPETMGDATPTPLPPFAAAVLQSMLTAAQQDLTRLTACKPPAPGPHAVALQQMLTAVRARVRRDSKSATADQATQAVIDPETTT